MIKIVEHSLDATNTGPVNKVSRTRTALRKIFDSRARVVLKLTIISHPSV